MDWNPVLNWLISFIQRFFKTLPWPLHQAIFVEEMPFPRLVLSQSLASMNDYSARAQTCPCRLACVQQWANPPCRLICGVGSSQTRHCIPNNAPQTYWTINISLCGVFLEFWAGDTQSQETGLLSKFRKSIPHKLTLTWHSRLSVFLSSCLEIITSTQTIGVNSIWKSISHLTKECKHSEIPCAIDFLSFK